MNSNNKKAILVLEPGCNNSCFFCELNKKNLNSFDFYVKKLKEYRNKGFSSLDINGGEPTMYKNIFKLIRSAKKLGYRKITLFTNGRLLAYKNFAYKLITAGVDKFFITFFSNSQKTHNLITRTPGSFSQSFKGLNNLRVLREKSKKNIEIFINITLLKENSEKIKDIVFFFKYYADNVNLMPLLPGVFYKKNRIQAYKSFHCNLQNLDLKDERIKLSNFPACMVKGNTSNTKNKAITVLTKDMDFKFNDIIEEFSYFKKECKTCEMLNKCFGYIKNTNSGDFFTLWFASDLHISKENKEKIKCIFKDLDKFAFTKGIVAGDVVEGELDYSSYSIFKEIKQKYEIVNNLDFIAGNHDYLYKDFNDTNSFSLQKFLTIVSKKLNFSITKGNVHLIFASMDKTPNKIKDKTVEWIKKEAKTNQNKIVVLVTHIPFFSINRHIDKVDIWISGHKSFSQYSLCKDLYSNNKTFHIYAGDINSMTTRFLVFKKNSKRVILKRRNHLKECFENEEELNLVKEFKP